MAEQILLERRPPALLPDRSHAGLVIDAMPPMARFVLWANATSAQGISEAIGLNLPLVPLGSAEVDARAALWQGPGEWLLLVSEMDGPVLENALGACQGVAPHALIEVSHRQFGVQLSGEPSAFVLSAGCPLDLSLTAFPVGATTRTLLGKVEVTLWRRGPHQFHLEVWRSYARYVADFLDASLAGLPS